MACKPSPLPPRLAPQRGCLGPRSVGCRLLRQRRPRLKGWSTAADAECRCRVLRATRYRVQACSPRCLTSTPLPPAPSHACSTEATAAPSSASPRRLDPFTNPCRPGFPLSPPLRCAKRFPSHQQLYSHTSSPSLPARFTTLHLYHVFPVPGRKPSRFSHVQQPAPPPTQLGSAINGGNTSVIGLPFRLTSRVR